MSNALTADTASDWSPVNLNTHPAGPCRVQIDRGWYGDTFIKSARWVSGRIVGSRRSNYNGHVAVMTVANIARGVPFTFDNCHPECVKAIR